MYKQFDDAESKKVWTVKVIERGASFGREGCLEHDKLDPLVEFYEGDFMITRYYLSTILNLPYDQGILLDGSPPWPQVSGDCLNEIRHWLMEEK